MSISNTVKTRLLSPGFSFWLLLVYFAACFFYILWRLEPALYYQCQIPPFVWEDTFWQRFLTFPGGISEYLSNLFSQFYYYPVAGGMIITSSLVLTFLLSRALMKIIFPGLKNPLAFIPAILLLMLSSEYEHRLTYTLAWLQTLVFMLIYFKVRFKPVLARFAIFTMLAIILYFTSAGFLLLFGILSILFEILFQRNWPLGLALFFIIIALPYLAKLYLFIQTTKGAYFYLLLPVYDYQPAITPYLFYLYFPLIFVLASTGIFEKIKDFAASVSRKAAVVSLFIVTIIAALISFDAPMHTVLKVDYYAHNRQWDQLLNYVEKHPSDDVLVVFQTNRALYHTGRLSSDMFSYDQSWGPQGLLLPNKARKFFSIQVSDLYWDLGLLNEARHWVLEDHSNFYNSPWHLQRMASIAILKGHHSLAEMCLDALDKTILYRDWAKEYRTYVNNPSLVENNSEFVNAKNKVENDFIISTAAPEHDLSALVARNPENKMAFEYLMANFMLGFRLDVLASFLNTTGKTNDADLPRHYQEALVVYLQNTRWKNSQTLGKGVGMKTMVGFNDFIKILRRYQGDAVAAHDELEKKYGDTYWFYSLYNNPEMKKVLSQQ